MCRANRVRTSSIRGSSTAMTRSMRVPLATKRRPRVRAGASRSELCCQRPQSTNQGAVVLERSEYPPGVPCWVDTAQPDPEAAVRFYGGLFGWDFEDRMPSDAPGNYFVGRLHDRDVAAVGSQPEGAPPTPAWSTYISVDSADTAA